MSVRNDGGATMTCVGIGECQARSKTITRLKRELAEALDLLHGIKEYREKNQLGGPAKVFDAMADQIRAGDDYNAVLKEYGFCHEAELARVKAHAEAMYFAIMHMTLADSMLANEWADEKAAEAYRSEFPKAQ